MDNEDLTFDTSKVIEIKVLGSPVKVQKMGEKYDNWFKKLLNTGKGIQRYEVFLSDIND